MKINILNKIVLLVLVTILFNSCQKWIDTDVNTDPSRPTNATVNLMLPGIQADLAYNSAGDMLRPNCVWMQQLAGVSSQMEDVEKYTYTESDVDNMWKYGMYAAIMNNIKILIDKSNVQKMPHFAGIGRVLMAYSLGITTDLFGDIPYSESFQGNNKLKPAYDKQQKIYQSIQTLLDSAIINFNDAMGNLDIDPTVTPSVDLIYGGDVAKWTKAAYLLKARYSLHLSKINATAYQDALTALNNGAFTSNADDMQLKFGSNSNENAPMFQFNDQRNGYIVMGGYLVDTLNGLKDPRRFVYADTSSSGGVAIGSHAGELNSGASLIGPSFLAPDAAVCFVSYAEQKFIEAEAKFKTADLVGAAAAYNAGVKASILKNIGASDATYEAANASETDVTIKLEKIMFQKYLAMFLNQEAYTDWRRTGIPALSPSIDNTNNGVIPRRYPYPQSERLFNSTNYAPYKDYTKNTPVWWDGGTK